MKAVVVLVVVLAAAAGGYFMFLKPVAVPDVAFYDADKQPLTLSEIRGDKDALLIFFMMPRCGITEFSSGVVKEAYAERGESIQFAGLAFGPRDTAERLKEDLELPFPVFGLRDAPDPFATNEFFELLRSMGETSRGLYGGSVVVIDFDNKLKLFLEKEEVRDLGTKLTEAGF